jgi:hypothetical protein
VRRKGRVMRAGGRGLIFLVVLVFSLPGCGGGSSSEGPPPGLPKFIVCKSTYALCTSAFCTAIPGNDDQVSCACTVETGYSAGLSPCQPITVTPEGTQIVSRYFPIRSYAVCNNSRPWANCVDSPCIVDPNGSSFATCTCDLVQNQDQYIISNAVEQYSSNSCSTGIISSATLTGANQLTEFLKFNDKLHPFKPKVFTGE